MKTSLIITVFNEEKSIDGFLSSVISQSILPDELIIVDGGSRDSTIQKINAFKDKNKKLSIKVFEKKGNRSLGRNEAIRRAKNEIIAISDAGNTLDKNWLKNITSPFLDKKTDVVSGYYKGVWKTIFQKCLIPFVLVMPDRLNPMEFLPATRSMAIRKSVWEKLGGFDENLSHNEDYDFSNRLKKAGANIIFRQSALVSWIPRSNFKSAFIMFFRFALGDAESRNFREKVTYLFLRYLFIAYLTFLTLVMKSYPLLIFYLFLLVIYIIWSIRKNYRYVNHGLAFIFLPLLQILSDMAIISGTTFGILKLITFNNARLLIKNNWKILLVISGYILAMLSVINWGIPDFSHPFTYHMDEWHFSQALRTFLKFGTGSYSGAASIPLFHILSTYVFLAPFYLLRVFDPFLIKSSLDNLSMQHTFFVLLRSHTLLYGVMSIGVMYGVLKKYLNFKPLTLVLIFVSTPIWIMLSNYYKYDITLNFWIITTLFFIFRFNKSKKFSDYIFAGIACAISLSTKFTAAPLFIIYLISYVLFAIKFRPKEILIAFILVVFLFITVGIPDAILLKGNYYELLNSTLVRGPKDTSSYILNAPSSVFLLFEEIPQMFGYFLTALSYVAVAFWSIFLLSRYLDKKLNQYKIELFVLVSFLLYIVPTISFGIDGGNNRALVLLPFMIIISTLFLKYLHVKVGKAVVSSILILGVILQLAQTVSWQSVKLMSDPRVIASSWLSKNLSKGTTIGLENIPIYQQLPDIILSEFYEKEGDKNVDTRFNYKVISPLDSNLPEYVIISNDYNNVNYIAKSPKKELVSKLKSKGYKKIITFSPYLSLVSKFSSPLIYMITYPTPFTLTVYKL